MVAYATGFLLGLLAAAVIDWWRRRALRAQVYELERKHLIALHDLWAVERELAAAIADRKTAHELLAAELRRELV